MPIHRSGMSSPAGVQRRSRMRNGKGQMPVEAAEDMTEDEDEEEEAEESSDTHRNPMAGCKIGPSVTDLRKTLTAIKQVTTNK